MSSLLSFAWNKSSNKKKVTSTEEKDSVPGVAPSSSGEEHLSPTASMLDGRQSTYQARNSSTPPTPEGLKPRRCLIEVRKELRIPILPERNLPGTGLPLSSRSQQEKNIEILPVWPSNRIATNPSLNSPQISNASFYSRSLTSCDPVAGSPNLDAPTTAVGALVAATTYHKVASNPYSLSQIHQPNSAFEALPPRSWVEDNTNNDDTFDLEDSELTPSYERLHDEEDDDSSQENNAWNASFSEVDRQFYGRPMDKARSYIPQDEENDADLSHISNGSNFGSQVGLVSNKTKQTAYDFDPILKLNVSAISGQIDDQSSLSSCGDRRGHAPKLKRENTSVEHYSYASMEYEEVVDSIDIHKKRENQRSKQEKRLLECIERLQSDVSLVAEIEQSSPSSWSEADDWFLKTPMDKEGLLLGLSSETTQRLSKRINSILIEMSNVPNEEFFFRSPTEIEEYGETHTDLELALCFLQQLLSLKKENKWTCKFQIRAEMGVEPLAGSPEQTARGGDTSVFTLPEDIDTPHTSNLSVATTITTKVSPVVTKSNKLDASEIRRTIEIFSTLLQRLTLACDRLLKTDHSHASEAILATEDIKRFYLQLLSIKNSELRNVLDAFLETPPLLVRTVSLDDDQQGGEEAERASIFQNETILTIHQPEPRHLLGVFNGQVMSAQNKCVTSTRIEEEGEYDEEDGEDLRRQVGSNDYEEESCCREGPEYDPEERDTIQDFYQQDDYPAETKVGNLSCGSI